MARKEARVQVTIWSDPEFVALSQEDQRNYFHAFTQPGISLCGVLPLTMGRWTGMAADVTPEGMRASFDRLEVAKFILVDYETDELLVRSFLRHDGVWRNAKTQAGALAQRKHIISKKIGNAVDREIFRLRSGSYWDENPTEDDLSSGRFPVDNHDEQSPSPVTVSSHQSPTPLAHITTSNNTREGVA
jgi:hypothetical protein